MRPRMIKYNRLFEVVREKDEWILSKRKSMRNAPIFDLDEKRWCSIERSKNNQWFILFYKDGKDKNSPLYYKSFARAQGESLTLFFNNFNEVIKDETGRWMIKTGRDRVGEDAATRQE